MKLTTLACMASALLLASCGGGSNATTPQNVVTPGPGVTTQSVSGTLLIGNPGTTTSSKTRNTAFVSSSTMHVALFIDGAAATAGAASGCTATTGGTGTSTCTITWAAQLTVPAAHTFAVEADSGTNAPANTVLSEGSGSYPIVAGTANALGTLSLNGVAKNATFTVATCSGAAPNSLCTGNITIAAPANNAIAYTGSVVVPTAGSLPTSGNVFDNGAVTFVSSTPANGTLTGTAQTASANTFSTLTAGTLSVAGVDTTGVYTYQVTCGATATGTFGITIGGAATPSGLVTTAELAALPTAVTYPAAGIVVLGTPVSFTCTGGNITSSGGTLPVN